MAKVRVTVKVAVKTTVKCRIIVRCPFTFRVDRRRFQQFHKSKLAAES